MRKLIHEKKVQRKGNLGKYSMMGGLALLVIGFFISLQRDVNSISTLIILASVGTLVTQAGSVFFAKYGQKPRPDEILAESFKGLSNSHFLFHDVLNTDHALLGPSGAAAVLAYQIDGDITYTDGMFYVQGKRGLFGRPRKKKLRNVEKTASREVRDLARALHAAFPDREEEMVVQPLVVFVNEDVTVDAENAPITAVHANKAKNAFKRLPMQSGFSIQELTYLASSRGFEDLE